MQKFDSEKPPTIIMQPLNPISKFILNSIAYLCIGLGVLGIFLPLLPTTPFLLLAMLLLTKSNLRIANWLKNNRYLGVYVQSYVSKQKLPRKNKIQMIVTIWLTIGLSIIFLTDNIYARGGLVLLAIVLTVHVARLRSRSGVDRCDDLNRLDETGDTCSDTD